MFPIVVLSVWACLGTLGHAWARLGTLGHAWAHLGGISCFNLLYVFTSGF